MVWCLLTTFPNPEFDRYRLVLIEPSTRLVFAQETGGDIQLPRVSIPRWTRPAQGISAAIKDRWGSQAIILDEIADSSSPDRLILAETIYSEESEWKPSGCHWKKLDDISDDQLSKAERDIVKRLLAEGTTGRGPFSKLGWMEEVLYWISGQTGIDRSQLGTVEQINASSTCSLVRIGDTPGSRYWFKAVTEPEVEEYRITSTLRDLFPDYLPLIVGARDDLHGWLMEDAGCPLDELKGFRPRLLEEVAHHLAELQKASEDDIPFLLANKCADRRSDALRASIPEIMEHLEEVIQVPDAGNPSRLWPSRIRELAKTLQDAISRLEAIGIPDTLIHNDIDFGNILIGEGSCIFTDWEQAAIGNPFVTFEQLRAQVAQDENTAPARHRFLAAYQRSWTKRLGVEEMQQAFHLVGPVSVAMYLHSRRAWLTPDRLHEPQFQSYARSLARQLDRAMRQLEIRERISV